MKMQQTVPGCDRSTGSGRGAGRRRLSLSPHAGGRADWMTNKIAKHLGPRRSAEGEVDGRQRRNGGRSCRVAAEHKAIMEAAVPRCRATGWIRPN